MQLSPDSARELGDSIGRALNGVAYWVPWVERAVRVVVILGGAAVLTRIFGRLLRKVRLHATHTMSKHGDMPAIELEKRSATVAMVLGKVVSSIIWMIATVMALNELTFNVQPLLAGLGVAGLALGLGAQTLIKDWLGGFFLLIEDQIRIGDSVTINGISGAVEEINLRTTMLRAENGALHMIPNGAITQLSNLTREYSYYVMEITIAHGAPSGKALELLKKAGDEVAADPEFEPLILAPMEVMGVDRMVTQGAVLRARIKTLPSKQYLVGRELNRRVKEAFDAAGIAFA